MRTLVSQRMHQGVCVGFVMILTRKSLVLPLSLHILSSLVFVVFLSWIQRRNACPLCLDENIAVPRHDPEANLFRVETAPRQEAQESAAPVVQQPEAFL